MRAKPEFWLGSGYFILFLERKLKPGFKKAEELIREIASALDATAKNVEETDNNIASQFRA